MNFNGKFLLDESVFIYMRVSNMLEERDGMDGLCFLGLP